MSAIRLYFMNPNLIDLYGFGLIRIASLDFVSSNRFLRIGLTLRMEIRGFISKCVGGLENWFSKMWNPIYHFPWDLLRSFLWNWLVLNFHTFPWRHNWKYIEGNRIKVVSIPIWFSNSPKYKYRAYHKQEIMIKAKVSKDLENRKHPSVEDFLNAPSLLFGRVFYEFIHQWKSAFLWKMIRLLKFALFSVQGVVMTTCPGQENIW